MLKINQIKLPVGHAPEELEQKIRKTLRLSRGEAFSYKIVRKSFDARKKPEIYEVYSVTVEIKDEDKILKKLHTPSISKAKEVRYQFPERGSEKMKARPVIVGAGPAGLFAALQLTEAGYADGLIRGAQIRLDHPLKDKDDPPEKTGVKYLTLSSTGKRMGTTSGSPIHFVGDPCSRVVYVTEGCLKADVAHALMHRTFVATLGVNNTAKLDELFAFLHRNGTEEIIEAEDMDKYSNEMVEKGASKIYALAARHGMRCRRLTWNPNYKGIDDWQLALRRKEQKMKEDPGMTFKEQYLNGLCGLEMLEACTEKWHAMKVDSISLRDYLGLTEQEYDAYLQTTPGVSFRELLDSQRKTQRFRVYQLDLEHGETRAFAFGGIDALHKAGFQQPPAAEYTLVYDGELTCPVGQDERDILERIFARYNQAFPPDYRGRSIAPSDVLELYDESERRYFYCDMAGFLQVKFSPALAKKA